MAYTQGPWQVQDASEGNGLIIKPVPGQVVAEVDAGDNQLANARLIAAAPEMLGALNFAYNSLLQSGFVSTKSELLSKIGRAIGSAS